MKPTILLELSPRSSPIQNGESSAQVQIARFDPARDHSHDFSHFVDDPPSIAEGGKDIVVPGCPRCRVRIHTMSQFLDHLANDAMPALVERLAQINRVSVS